MTESPFKSGLICILDAEGMVIGTGFLVAERLALTCAHVVRQAGSNPGGKVNIRFAIDGSQQSAQVDANAWSSAEEHDVALLHISNAPEAAKPLPLGNSAGSAGHPFRSFGYAKVGSLQGIGARGQIVEVVDQGQSLQITSQEIDRGFSGSPVVDDVRGVGVGMITWGKVMTSTERNRDTTFAVTVETIRAICPELQLTEICPYRGLDAFTEDTARFFHGRSRVISRLVESLKKQSRFLAVLGPSGCGKSSLVQAGLIPQLRDGALVGGEHWHFFAIRPGNDPLAGLETAGLPGTTGGLYAAMGQWSAAHSQAHPVLLLDQFEELFTVTSEAARERFLEQLAELLVSDLPVTVILTLRDDFYSLFIRQSPALTPWLERGLINVPLNLERGELHEIIATPAKLVGLQFEPGLVDTIIDDVLAGSGESASTLLPLLEFALTQLWERRQDGVLTHAAYQKLGGVAGGLASWAGRAYKDVPEENRKLVRHVLTYLVRLGDEKQNLPDTRRRMALTDLVPSGIAEAEVRIVVKSLADAHLLVSHGDEVEIIHEILLHSWSQLREWLDEDRAGLRTHQHLTEAAAEWRRLKFDIGQLYTKAKLAEAVEWAKTHPTALNELENNFLSASREHEQREASEREGQIKRELQLMSEKAETEERRALEQARATQKLKQRNRIITIVGIIAVVAAFVAVLFGVAASRNAERATRSAETAQASAAESRRQAQIALSRQYAALAWNYIDERYDLSALFSVESIHITHTAEAETVLLTGLQSHSTIRYLPGPTKQATLMNFSEDGKLLAVANCEESLDNTSFCQKSIVRLWEIPLRQPLEPSFVIPGKVDHLLFSYNRRTLIVGVCRSSDSTYCNHEVWVWDVLLHSLSNTPLVISERYPLHMDIRLSDNVLAVASCRHQQVGDDFFHCLQSEINFFDLESSQPVYPTISFPERLGPIAFVADHFLMVSRCLPDDMGTGCIRSEIQIIDLLTSQTMIESIELEIDYPLDIMPIDMNEIYIGACHQSEDLGPCAQPRIWQLDVTDNGSLNSWYSQVTPTSLALFDGEILAIGANVIEAWQPTERWEHLLLDLDTDYSGMVFNPSIATAAAFHKQGMVVLFELGWQSPFDELMPTTDTNAQTMVQSACEIAGRNFTQPEWAQFFPGELYRITCLQWPAGK